MNSKNVSEPTGEQMTLFSPVGSLNHANHTASQESDLEKKMTATSGRKCLDVFEKFDRNGLWARTYSELLIGTGGWFSTRCNLTWKVKATKYKRMYFQLAPSTPRIDGTGFGLLPTPSTAELNAGRGSVEYSKRQLENPNRQNHLAHLAKTGLLPTPQAIDGNGQGRDLRLKKDCNRDPEQPGSWRGDLKDFAAKGLLPTPQARDEKNGSKLEDGRIQRKIQQGWSMGLNDLGAMGFLPTPTASECRDSQLTPEQAKTLEKGGRVLGQMGTLGVLGDGKTSLQLNPRFVGEMMGFPPGWTESPFLSGEMKASKPTETP